MDELLTVESRVTPPSLSCPSFNGLLPFEFGDVECVLCGANVRVDHQPTRRAWKEEKVSCPNCSKVLIAGVDKRPAHLKCGSCSTHFDLLPKVVKVEISCPNCQRKLRMKKRPGSREICCPACETDFVVKF